MKNLLSVALLSVGLLLLAACQGAPSVSELELIPIQPRLHSTPRVENESFYKALDQKLLDLNERYFSSERSVSSSEDSHVHQLHGKLTGLRQEQVKLKNELSDAYRRTGELPERLGKRLILIEDQIRKIEYQIELEKLDTTPLTIKK